MRLLRQFQRDEAHLRLLAALGRLTQGEGAPQPVALGCFEDLAPIVLAPLLSELARDHPALAVVPRVGGFEQLAGDLAQGRLDLALSYDLGFDDRYEREEIARLAPHAVLAPDHPLAARAELSLADLAGEPLVLADQGLSLSHMRALFSHAGLTPRIAHRTPSLETMRSFAANGLGVGLSYTRPAPGQSYDGRPLVTRPVTGTGAGEPVVIVRLKGAASTQAAETVARTIRAAGISG